MCGNLTEMMLEILFTHPAKHYKQIKNHPRKATQQINVFVVALMY